MDRPTESLDISHEFAEVLGWHIHTENLDGFVTEWIYIASRDSQFLRGASEDMTSAIRTKYRWARLLYGGVINAHLRWAPDNTANSAIAKLKADMGGNRANRFRRFKGVVGVAPAYTMIRSYLESNTVLPCDPKLYEDFMCLSRAKNRVKIDQAQREAQLYLFHPTKPEGRPILEYVQSLSGKNLMLYPLESDARRAFLAEKFLLRACFILRLQERDSDAEWLESYLRNQFPEAWAMRDQWFYFMSQDPKLRDLIRKKPEMGNVPRPARKRKRLDKPSIRSLLEDDSTQQAFSDRKMSYGRTKSRHG